MPQHGSVSIQRPKKVRDLVAAQKTPREAEGSDEIKATSAGQNPAAGDGGSEKTLRLPNKTLREPEGNIEGSREVRENKEEKRENAPGSLSSCSNSLPDGRHGCGHTAHSRQETGRQELVKPYFVWLATAYSGLSLSRKQKAEIGDFILGSTYDDAELKMGTNEILAYLDISNSFEHAGDKLAVGLEDRCAARQQEREQRGWERALIAETGAAEHAKALEAAAAFDRIKAEEKERTLDALPPCEDDDPPQDEEGDD
jgi:hypothetical protein